MGEPDRYVGRGGHKLEAALDGFGIDPTGWRVLDAGASTGGFTDCLLQHGAAQVIAVDVGHGQLHERLRSDPRVDVRERQNVRSIDVDDLDGPVDAAVADLSFISLSKVLGPIAGVVRPGGDLVVLVKPQFEAGRREVSKGRGVISDPDVWRRVLREALDACRGHGAAIMGAMVSPLRGADGNVEFLVHAGSAPIRPTTRDVDVDASTAGHRARRRRCPSTASRPDVGHRARRAPGPVRGARAGGRHRSLAGRAGPRRADVRRGRQAVRHAGARLGRARADRRARPADGLRRAFGFSVLWWWFFTDTLANCSKVVPYLRACSIPASAKTAGIVAEPSSPSFGMPRAATTAAEEPLPHLLDADREHDVVGPGLDCHPGLAKGGRAGGARVRVFTTGMPVWPISWRMRCPTMAFAW